MKNTLPQNAEKAQDLPVYSDGNQEDFYSGNYKKEIDPSLEQSTPEEAAAPHSYVSLIALLGLLFLVIAGTAGVIATYTAPPKQKPQLGFSLSRESVQVHKEQVILLMRMKKYREAINLLHRVVAYYPGNQAPVVMLSKVHFLRKEYESALYFLRQLQAADSVSPLIRNNRGCIFVAQGYLESGLKELQAAEKLSGGAGYIYENLAVAYFLSGQGGMVKRCWQKALWQKNDPTSPSAPAEAIRLSSQNKDFKE